jgi:hypothetical protein
MAVSALVLVAVAIVPGQGQSTDPKATDMNGNGPPAFVMSKDKQDSSNQADQPKDDKKKAAAERPLSGFVTDANDKPIVGAVVQLKNARTLQIRSYITHDKGDYYFSGLNKDVDYEVKAQFQGHTSPARTLSSFDTKTQPVLNLQIK